jgi:hypothetical protein
LPPGAAVLPVVSEAAEEEINFDDIWIPFSREGAL